MKNETKAEKIIRTEIEKWSILKPTSMAKDIIKALKEANLISSNSVLADSKEFKTCKGCSQPHTCWQDGECYYPKKKR